MILNDDSPMPFGKHEGKEMIDVPASYFMWLWNKDEWYGKPAKAVRNYIEDNLEAFKLE